MKVAQKLLADWMNRVPHISSRWARNVDKLNRSRNSKPAHSYRDGREQAILDGHLVKYDVPR